LSRAGSRARGDPPTIPKSRIGNVFDGLNSGGRTPGPNGKQAPTPTDRRLRDFLSDYDNLRDAFVSLIGKMQLSVDYAYAAMIFGSTTGPQHIFRLPDAVLRYVLLSYEVTGGDEDWLWKVSDTIFRADQEVGFEKAAAAKSHAVLNFKFHDDRIGMTYS